MRHCRDVGQRKRTKSNLFKYSLDLIHIVAKQELLNQMRNQKYFDNIKIRQYV